MRGITRREVLFAGVRCAALVGASGLAGCGPPAGATPRKVHRIGWLITSPISNPIAVESFAAFRTGMRDLGYVEGDGFALDVRSVEGQPERIPELASAIVATRPDVIVCSQAQICESFAATTKAIPIVIVGPDPSRVGVTDRAHPGGNITGIGAADASSLVPKRLQLLKEAVPGIRRLAVLVNPSDPKDVLVALHEAASAMGTEIILVELRSVDEMESALASVVTGGADALMVLARVLALPRAAQLAEFTTKYALPSMHTGREFVEAGALMSYSPDLKATWRRAAVYVDRILRGSYAGDLPVESPDQPELTVNRCTAAKLGVTLPVSILSQATVIECAGR